MILFILLNEYIHISILSEVFWQNRIHIYKNQAKNAYLCVCAISEIGTTLADQLGRIYVSLYCLFQIICKLAAG